jgi:hypothetical protein
MTNSPSPRSGTGDRTLAAVPAHRQFTGADGVGPVSRGVLVFYAVLVAASGFIPIPLVDDLIPRQLVRQLIRTILRQTGRRYSTARVKPLYAGEGCLAGALGILLKLPIDLLIYPVRKLVRVIKGIRSLSQRLVSTYLLGHTVNRYVVKDWLAQDTSEAALSFQSQLLRNAFETALKETNPVVFAQSVATVLGGLRGLPLAAWRTARQLLRRSARDVPDGDHPFDVPTPTGRVAGATQQVQQTLDDPEVQHFVAQFDAVVDREVTRQLAAAAATGKPSPGVPPSTPSHIGD